MGKPKRANTSAWMRSSAVKARGNWKDAQFLSNSSAFSTLSLGSAGARESPARKILRSIHEGARDMARDIAVTEDYVTSRHQQKKVEMLFAHLKRILKLDRLRLRGPNGAHDEFHLAATAQNFRKLAKLLPQGPQTRTA